MEWNVPVIDFHHFILAKIRQHLIPGRVRPVLFQNETAFGLDEQDLQQDDVCNKLPSQRANPGFVGQTRREAILSHSSRRLLLGDQTTLLDSCNVFGILSSTLTKDMDPK